MRATIGLGALLALAAFILGPLLSLLMWAVAGTWLFPSLLPEFSLKWWFYVLGQDDVVKSIRMSLESAPVATTLSALICIPAAYAFARLEFPGRRILLLSFLSANAFPKIGLYVSIATLFYRLNLMDTFAGVVMIQLINTLLFMIWIPDGDVPRDQPEPRGGRAGCRGGSAQDVLSNHAADRAAGPDRRGAVRVHRRVR